MKKVLISVVLMGLGISAFALNEPSIVVPIAGTYQCQGTVPNTKSVYSTRMTVEYVGNNLYQIAEQNIKNPDISAHEIAIRTGNVMALAYQYKGSNPNNAEAPNFGAQMVNIGANGKTLSGAWADYGDTVTGTETCKRS